MHLFSPRKRNFNVLDWDSRFTIITGIANGLRHLHEDSNVKIIHGDIKASNILLDDNLKPKITDFGLGKMLPDCLTHLSTRVAGTLGYLAPDYLMTGRVSEKADVYSYGILALEIISGRKVISYWEDPHVNRYHILTWAWKLYEGQEPFLIADSTMKKVGPINRDEVLLVLHVALLCTQSSPAARPAMSQVCTMLSSNSAILDNPTRPPDWVLPPEQYSGSLATLEISGSHITSAKSDITSPSNSGSTTLGDGPSMDTKPCKYANVIEPSHAYTQWAPKFTIQELQEATGNFNPDNKLGHGGFGPVYKGTLRNGRDVAIKMLSRVSNQGKSEFMNELQLITGCVQHRNLIQLLGCCVEDTERLLVYEYLPNRSLDLHLFGPKEENFNVLDWKSRCNIITRIARGLSYLHEDTRVKIVHGDIKPSNILLDSDLNPQIADFGLARLIEHDVITHVTTRVLGTKGYFSPEYVFAGQLSEKADVYSYGLVVLEIISGRKVIERSEEDPHISIHILKWAWELYERQEPFLIGDLKMDEVGLVNQDEVVRMVHIALLCTQSRPNARPTMSQVCAMLCNKSINLDKPTKPTDLLAVMSPMTRPS